MSVGGELIIFYPSRSSGVSSLDLSATPSICNPIRVCVFVCDCMHHPHAGRVTPAQASKSAAFASDLLRGKWDHGSEGEGARQLTHKVFFFCFMTSPNLRLNRLGEGGESAARAVHLAKSVVEDLGVQNVTS
jgi:hypothetical protein